MARNVPDVALMLDAMVGHHPEDPISLSAPTVPFLRAVDEPVVPRRIAWSADLGISPLHPEVRAVCERAVARIGGMGVEVDETCPDMSEAEQTFKVIRNMQRVGGTMELLEKYRDKLSPEIIHYATAGLSLTARDIAQADLARARSVSSYGGILQDI